MTPALDPTEKMIYLRAVPVAAELSPPVLKVIASCLRERTFCAGERLMSLGRPIDALYFLTEGRVSLVRRGASLGALEPPQTLGFLGILAQGDGTYDATADDDVFALELDAATLRQLLEDHFELARATLRYLSARLIAELQDQPAEALEARFGGTDAPDADRPPDLVQRILYLRTRAIFERTNLESLAALSRRAHDLRLGPGEAVWSEREPSDFFLMTLAGTAVQHAEEQGKRWCVGPNSAVGTFEAMASAPRWTTLRAEGPFIALRIAIDDFWELLEDDFSTASRLIAFLAADLVDLLAAKAASGQASVAVPRAVPGLGKVPVGA